MSDKDHTVTTDGERGLYGKYRVERVDGRPLKGGMCIVLEVGDPNAHPALRVWAETVRTAGYAQLADDIERLLPLWENGSYPPLPGGMT